MKKKVARLLTGAAGICAIVLFAAITAQIFDRGNVLDRITHWPELEVHTLEGNQVSTSKLLSGKPIFFNYYSTECIYCQAEIRDIAEHTELQELVTLVFISNERPEVIQQFRGEYGLMDNSNFLFLVDNNSTAKDYFGIRSVPATYLYNSEGEMINFFRGQIKAETLYSHFSELEGECTH